MQCPSLKQDMWDEWDALEVLLFPPTKTCGKGIFHSKHSLLSGEMNK